MTADEPIPEAWRMEEKVTFLERELEHLRDQVSDVWTRLTALERRLDKVLSRLESAGEAE